MAKPAPCDAIAPKPAAVAASDALKSAKPVLVIITTPSAKDLKPRPAFRAASPID